jgi:hypothetical protein
MGFQPRSKAKVYEPADGDTLKIIADRETAAGNRLSASEIAMFNWGTNDPEIIEEFMRDILGCHDRGPDNRFIITPDIQPETDLLIPLAFSAEALATDSTHTLNVRRTPAPPTQFRGCARIQGVTFEFDQSFVRPSVVADLVPLEEKLKKHPDAKVIIFGHTDKVGSETYNKDLSERRARSVYAFITNQPDLWEELYQKENWGIRAVQEILKDMGGRYDPGPVDGIDGPQTKQAVRNFQEDNGLAVDGVAGPNTRNTLFTAYMSGKHDIEIDDGRFFDPKHMGCGEFNPIVETEDPNEENRRVTFFLFAPDRLPRIPCLHGDLGPCRVQTGQPLPRHRDSFHCSFFDSIAVNCSDEKPVVPIVDVGLILMRVFDVSGVNPLAGRSYHIQPLSPGGIPFDGTIGDDGLVRHEGVPPGDYQILIQGVVEDVAALVFSLAETEPQIRYLHTIEVLS